jgi:hypothetical protein
MDRPASKCFALRANGCGPLVLRQFLLAAAMAVILGCPVQAEEQPPLPPTAVTAETTAEGVLLGWAPPVLSFGEILAYNVYRINGTQPEALGSVAADQTSYFDGSADLDYVYTYFVTSQAAQAESAPSNPSFAGYPRCYDVTYDECLFPLPIESFIDATILKPLTPNP